MYQFFVSPSQIQGNRIVIAGDDVNHIRNVLRMKPGEEIAVSNGVDGREYRCRIETISGKEIVCSLCFIREAGVELPVQVTLFQALPKADKMEWIVQKAVELGVYGVVPVETKRCVTKLDAKKAGAKTARWQAIAEAAAKQSKRRIIPQVSTPCSFAGALQQAAGMDVRLIPYELAEGMEKTRELFACIGTGCRVAVFIGPEGGFAPEEIELAKETGFSPVTLGKRILRTETAGMVVLAWLGYLLEP